MRFIAFMPCLLPSKNLHFGYARKLLTNLFAWNAKWPCSQIDSMNTHFYCDKYATWVHAMFEIAWTHLTNMSQICQMSIWSYRYLPYRTVRSHGNIWQICQMFPCEVLVPVPLYHTVRTVPYHAVPHRTVPHRTVPHRTVPHRTVPHRTVPYRTIPYRN
jgi:hypothetical protein